MIRASIQYNSKPIDDLIGYLDGYAQVAEEEFNAAYTEVEPLLLNELQTEPGPTVHPIEWTSEKQRKAYFATDGFEHGIPYQRTGALAKAWQISKQGFGLNVLIKVLNPNPASPFVYGSLSITNRGNHKQQFHSNTGWQTAGDTVDFWFVALTEQYIANMNARLGDVVGGTKTQRRAYTNTRRK